MTVQFQRAQRTVVKLKVLITGPSGAGKTLGALMFADGLASGKIAVLDSENDRASYYADHVNFDVLSLPDAQPRTYMTAMQAAVEAGYQVVILDSISHAWQNVLDRKTDFERANPKSNSYVNWKLFGAEWDGFIRAMLELPIHVIATARSKQDYEQTEVDGKKKVIKLGLAPQIREGTDFEFALHFDVNEEHKVQVRKDNTFLFGDERTVWDLTNGSLVKPLVQWLASAKPVAQPARETAIAIDEAIAGLPEGRQATARRRWASRRAKGVTEMEAQEILLALAPIEDRPSALPQPLTDRDMVQLGLAPQTEELKP